nr:hypothetical protein [Tanacetum cinerariifolium]
MRGLNGVKQVVQVSNVILMIQQLHRIRCRPGTRLAYPMGSCSQFKDNEELEEVSSFEKQKLTGPNFIDWYRQLRLVLSTKENENYLEHPISEAPIAPPGQQVPPTAAAAHATWVKGQQEVVVLMMLTMDLDIQRNLAHLVSLILVSLSKDYDRFVQNYNIHGMGKTVNELHAMLKLHEDTLPKKDVNPALHAIRARRVQKNQKNKPHKAAKGGHGKGKSKMGYAPNNALEKELSRVSRRVDKKRSYLKELALQGLRGSKKLKPGALSLYVGDGHRAFVEAIGTYHLELSSRLVIVLNNCHYAPSITRAIEEPKLIWILLSCGTIVLDISKKRIEKLQHAGLLNFIDIESLGKCVSCMSRKMPRKHYSHQVERDKDLLGLIYTDVCSPFRIVSRQGATYFVTFTDDFSRYGYVYLPKHKHKVFESFKVFQKEVENQLWKTIKSLRSDRGGEYMSQEFLDHLKEHGIIAHRTPPYTPQHNGVSERRTRTLLDMVQSMMSQTTLPKSFWDYALETATRILNMVLTKKVDKTPYEIWHGPTENKVFVTQNPEFFKNNVIDLKVSGSVEDLELIQEEDTNPSLDTSLDHEEDDQEIDEPQTALLDPESKKWLDVMNVKMQSMKDNDVWVLVELPSNARIVGSKWLFKKKTDMYGAVYVFKAHLEAKGFTQTYEVDYEETFSPVAYIRAIRILIAIAAYYDYEIWQMDVKTAFLNGHLSEEEYIEQPEGFVSPKYPKHVCKLKRSIDGHKQASRQWNKSFAMKDLGEAAYILGMKIYHDRSKRLIGLCQSAYIEKILKRYYMENSKRGTIPMQEKLKLSKSQGASTPAEKQRIQNVPYASAIGSNAEYIAAFDASKEVVWIRKFTSGLGIVLTIKEPISMYCDNTRAIAIAKDDGVTKGAKHFRAKVYHLRETIKLGDVKIEKVDTDDNLAEPFTKALAFPKHSKLTKNIKMLPASSFM